MITDIIVFINFILIAVLYILFFIRSSKEKFTGAPSGYTNLLVSDPDGNLDTFSLSTLESDIDTKITNLESAVDTKITNAISTAKSSAASLYQRKGDYLTNNVRVALRSGVESGCGDGKSKYLVNGCGSMFRVHNLNREWKDISAGLMSSDPPQGGHVDDHTWYLQRY